MSIYTFNVDIDVKHIIMITIIIPYYTNAFGATITPFTQILAQYPHALKYQHGHLMCPNVSKQAEI